MNPKLPNVTQWYGEKVAAELLRRDPVPKPVCKKPLPANIRKRPVPRLRMHKWGAAFVTYKVNGRRVAVYFGRFGAPAAAAKYNAWAARWPRQLTEPLPSGKWPKLRLLTHNGKTQTLAKWAREVGLKPTTLKNRLDVQKLPLAEALTRPRQQPHFARQTT